MKMHHQNDGNHIDKLIQANKDEADSTLSLWGLKPRRHSKPKRAKRK